MAQDDILTALRELSRQQTENHVELCQRITAVETTLALSPIAPIEERVRALEGWRAQFAGIVIAANIALASAIEWFHRR